MTLARCTDELSEFVPDLRRYFHETKICRLYGHNYDWPGFFSNLLRQSSMHRMRLLLRRKMCLRLPLKSWISAGADCSLSRSFAGADHFRLHQSPGNSRRHKLAGGEQVAHRAGFAGRCTEAGLRSRVSCPRHLPHRAANDGRRYRRLCNQSDWL